MISTVESIAGLDEPGMNRHNSPQATQFAVSVACWSM